MKKILMVLGLFVFPSVSLAAPLTPTQATSLINIVQSSPGTPASAFTDLITAFSNITVVQANSLIDVVQAAPGVPANAFVNMLIAFTQDTVQAPQVAPTLTQPTFGSIGTTTPVAPTPAPVVLPDVRLEVNASDCDDVGCHPSASTTVADMFRFSVKTFKNGLAAKLPVTVTTNDPDLPSQFQINAPDQVGWFCVAPSYADFPNHGCPNENPVTKGTFDFTFSVNDYPFTATTKTVEVK